MNTNAIIGTDAKEFCRTYADQEQLKTIETILCHYPNTFIYNQLLPLNAVLIVIIGVQKSTNTWSMCPAGTLMKENGEKILIILIEENRKILLNWSGMLNWQENY